MKQCEITRRTALRFSAAATAVAGGLPVIARAKIKPE